MDCAQRWMAATLSCDAGALFGKYNMSSKSTLPGMQCVSSKTASVSFIARITRTRTRAASRVRAPCTQAETD
jgi:hypothetical protein